MNGTRLPEDGASQQGEMLMQVRSIITVILAAAVIMLASAGTPEPAPSGTRYRPENPQPTKRS